MQRAAEIISEEQEVEVDFPESCRKKIAHGCGGDVRKAMNAVELAILVADEVDGVKKVSEESVAELVQKAPCVMTRTVTSITI